MEIHSLGYCVISSTNVQSWRDYAVNVLGMMVQNASQDGLYIKMDERPYRFLVVPGERDAYLASGWELPSQTAFSAALAELDQKNIPYTLGTDEECQLRQVQAIAALTDPSGNRHELFWGHCSDCQPFISPQGVGQFVTGDMGLGHTVLPAPNFAETLAFVKEVLGFETSDIFHFKPAPEMDPLPIHFMHCANPRHHSLALCAFPVESGCVHTMVEVENMTEVGRAYDRYKEHGVALSATLGQHLNDKMVSFYMKTPAGFDMEYGYGGLQVDWEEHSAFEFTRVSLWGHDFSVGQTAGDENE